MSGGTWLAPLVRARLTARLSRVCDIFLPQCKVNLVAAHTRGNGFVPRTQRRRAASSRRDALQSRGQLRARRRSASGSPLCAATLARCSPSGTRVLAINMPSRSRGASARVLPSVSPSSRRKGAGKAGRRLAPRVRTRKTHAGVTTGDAGTSGLPCAMVLRLMARTPRGAMHYCPRRLADDRCAHPVGPHIPASLDAQTPGVRTTRFCRPRTSLPGHPEARACSPPKPKRNAVTAPGRSHGS